MNMLTLSMSMNMNEMSRKRSSNTARMSHTSWEERKEGRSLVEETNQEEIISSLLSYLGFSTIETKHDEEVGNDEPKGY